MRDRIIEVAKSYLHIREKPGNSGFNDPKFEAEMKRRGWIKGQSWCAYFVELVYVEAEVLPYDVLNKLHSAGAVRTITNYRKMFPKAFSKVPTRGALVGFRHMIDGKPHPKGLGHIGICENPADMQSNFWTIDGNTNAAGSREGDRVAEKKRSLGAFGTTHGLQLIGFIDPVICAEEYAKMTA